MSDVEEIIERMMNAYRFEKFIELTKRLGVAHTAISGWRRREKVARSAIIKCSEDTGVSVDYIQYGVEEKNKKVTKSEFRFVFARIFSNAKMSGILVEGENFSNDKMIEVSDRIYDSITDGEVFSDLFDSEAL